MTASVLEAGVVGVPIPATNVRGTREIMQNCETGRLTPCGDLEKLRANIRRLIEDRNLRILLGKMHIGLWKKTTVGINLSTAGLVLVSLN